jgi:hypothetical protein
MPLPIWLACDPCDHLDPPVVDVTVPVLVIAALFLIAALAIRYVGR